MKHKYKKYKYLTKERVRTNAWFIKKRLESISFNGQLNDYAPLDTEKLPFPVNWSEYYKYTNLVVELGTGHGEFINFYSEKNKDDLIVGFEITKKYCKKSWNKISDQRNALEFKGDGYLLINNLFPNSSIDKVFILFPDPWHKKKHNKRRPITSDWLKELYKTMNSDGVIFFATDWIDYYHHVVEQFNLVPSQFEFETGVYEPISMGLVETHYYQKWKELGRNFRFIRAKKK